jgi:hypothetical protein
VNRIDPYAYPGQVAFNLDRLTRREQVETVLDEVEYLFDTIPPALMSVRLSGSRSGEFQSYALRRATA